MSEEKEEWRPVVGWEGRYEVSNYGRFKTLRFKGRWKPMILDPKPEKNGYIRVFLGNKVQRNLLHRLVAEAFPEVCGEWFEGCEVDHINTVRDDNRAINLRVCTKSENRLNPITRQRQSDSHKGRPGYMLGKRHTEESLKKMSEAQKNRKDQSKPVLQYDLEGNFITEYQSISEASRQTGISHSSISFCCNGKKGYSKAGCFVFRFAS